MKVFEWWMLGHPCEDNKEECTATLENPVTSTSGEPSPVPDVIIVISQVEEDDPDSPHFQKYILGWNPTLFGGGILPFPGLESYRILGGILPYSGAESYPILGQNPIIWGGILPYSEAQSYRLLERNPIGFLGGFFSFSWAEFYCLWGRNPTVF
ncbi:hypothetical protein Hamer_G013940 [Homarus americanus]|uniref:Uncharacterized protein n=1 Tax=Homarus americanus TaxID=6706 RepID=A0A8J5K777_HOMAM|nr:hypothetical protein Hamer_G013940 [Homarus americanus]